MDLSTDLPLLVASAAAALLGTLLLFGGKSSGRTILLTRRSHVKYAKKKVPQAAVDRALEAAILAPNHFLSEPWRFYQCGAETIKKFAALNADKAEACLAVPGMMVVTLTSKHKLDEKLGLEDHAAVRSAASPFFPSTKLRVFRDRVPPARSAARCRTSCCRSTPRASRASG